MTEVVNWNVTEMTSHPTVYDNLFYRAWNTYKSTANMNVNASILCSLIVLNFEMQSWQGQIKQLPCVYLSGKEKLRPSSPLVCVYPLFAHFLSAKVRGVNEGSVYDAIR